jgi:hypothetical protein
MRNFKTDINNIKLLMERMDGYKTFNEVNQNIKKLIVEGIGDEIISATRNIGRTSNFNNISLRSLETNASNMGAAIDNYDNAIRNIRSGGSFESLKNLLNAKSLRITMDNFAENLTILLIKNFDELNISVNRVNLKNYIMGNSIEMPTDLLRNLSPSQLEDLTKLNYLMNQLVITDFHLDKLNRINEMWNKLNKPEDFRNVILGFVSEDGIKSISELEDSFKRLDDLKNGSTPKEQELYDIWRRIKEQIGMSDWDGKDFKTLLKENFSNDPKFKITEKGFISKLKFWGDNKIRVKLEKLSTKNLNWENVIIYHNKSNGNTYVLEFKTKNQFDSYKKYLQQKGLDFETPGNKEGGINAVEKLAKFQLLRGKIIIGTYITVGATLLLATSYCLYSASDLNPESISLRKKSGGSEAVTDTSFIKRFAECGWSVLTFASSVVDLEDIWRSEILGPFQEFDGYIITQIEKICPPDTSGNEKCCMECNNDEKLKTIIADPKFIAIYEGVVKKLSPEKLKDIANKSGIENTDSLVADILEKAKTDKTVAGYLTEDGKPMTFQEILRMKCNQQALPCVEKRVKVIYQEILDIVATKDCDQIKNEAYKRVDELKSYGDAGYLTVNVSDKTNTKNPKVFIDIMKRQDIFGAVTNLDEFFIILRNWIDKVVIEAKCNTGAEETDEIDVDIVSDFEVWCDNNGKDSSKSKSLMEYLWGEGVAKLECDVDVTSEWFEPNIRNKENRKIQLFSIFDDHFKPVFPSIERLDDDWDDAFNYWYDKQKSYCGY